MTRSTFLLAGGLLCGAAVLACHPNPPIPPTPTPPPQPVVEFPNLVLKRAGNVLQYANGTPFTFRETIACCVGAEGTGWPDINKQTIDSYLKLGAVTVVHFRIGPFQAQNETEWASIGGGYLQQGSKVDLNTWNTTYWKTVTDTCRYANEHGIVCEIVPVDDWVLKVKTYGTGASARIGREAVPLGQYEVPAPMVGAAPYPWLPAGNIQGENADTQVPGPRQEQWLRKVVREFWTLGVVWQLGNEERQNQGYDFTNVTLARARIIRDEEAKLGSPQHPLSTNCDCDEALTDPVTDWYIMHNGFVRERLPKVASVNEYNPSVPASCAEGRAQWCKGEAVGTHFAAWRHEMTEPAWVCLQGTISEAKPCQPWESIGCESNMAPADTIACKRYSGNLFDCTPKRGGQPIKPEGTLNRMDCEYWTMGQGYPSYGLADVTGDLSLNVRGNPLQFVAKGTGRGRLTCTIPSRGGADVCRSTAGGPLWIEQ